MRSGLVVVKSPSRKGKTRLIQLLKPVLVQALVPKRAVKALDASVLRRIARRNQDVLDVVLLCPCHECPASELWPVVCPDSLGIAAKRRDPIQSDG